MKKLLTLLMLICVSLTMAAQKHVSGVVVDKNGEPIVGATIMAKGTTQGTISDIDGKFEMKVPQTVKILSVSFVGMKTVEVAAGQNVKVVLHDNTQLDEVVVTGYGAVSKGGFAGSAEAVTAETIEKKNSSEITKALANEVAGMQVVNSSGQPGSNATLVIRGVGSINGSATPLYVVDGMIYDGDISAIDPSDIASVTVLKDATATSLYGAQGANGVVVYTTKKGNSGEDGKIDVDVKYGCNTRLLPLYETISSPEQYVTLAWQSLYNGFRLVNGQSESSAVKSANNALYSSAGLPTAYNLWNASGKMLINPYDNYGNVSPSFDASNTRKAGYENLESWQNAIFRVGQKAEATVKFHGGSDKMSYYASVGYLKDEGYYQSSDFDRFNVRSNLDFKPKTWLKANLNLAYTYYSMNNPDQDGDGAMNNGFYYVNAVPAIYPVYLRDGEGNIAIDPRTGKYAYDYGDADLNGNALNRSFGMGINPAGSLQVDKENQVQHTLDAKGSLEFTLYKGLKFTANIGAHYYNNLYSSLTNKWYGDAAGLGRIQQQSYNMLAISAQQLLEYNNIWGDHTLRLLGGHETNYVNGSYIAGYKFNLASGTSLLLGNAVKMQSIAGNSTTYTTDSWLASVTYMYKERYGITANYRADGSSRYAKGHRWGHFGSIGASWNFTEEDFMAGAREYLKDGKLRLSWGVLGNQINSLYSYTDLYGIENVNDEIAYIWSSKGNPNLTWERTSSTDLGLEFKIGKYMDAQIDYFYKVTDNMLFYRYVSPSLGYSSIPSNDAKMMNQGIEFAFKVHAVNERNVKLDIRLNGAHYQNKMLEMPIDYYNADGTAERMIMSGAMAVGHSMYDHYTLIYKGVDDKGNSLFDAAYDSRYGGLGDQYTDPTSGLTSYNYISSLYLYEQEEIQKYMKQTGCSKAEAEKYIASVIEHTETTDGSYATSQYIGKSYLPDLEGGIGIALEAYGVTLDVACGYRIGGYGYDATYMTLMDNDQVGKHNWHVDMLNSWTETNTETNIPRLSNGMGEYDQYSTSASTRFLTSNSYFSLNSIQLGYNFPKKWIEKIKLQKLNIYFSATNLAIATARKGYNPTTSFTGSSDTHGYSPLSTFVGGIKFTI